MASLRRRVAFVTGIAGQIGSYLAEQLLADGYIVHGLVRRTSIVARPRIDHLQSNPSLELHYGDLADGGCLHRLLRDIRPGEIYNLAAQSHVQVSFGLPEFTTDVDYLGTLRLLEAFRAECPDARFYQASSSEIFGNSPAPQNEHSPFAPCSPYGIAKLASHWLCRNFRDCYGLFVACGICFNAESPRRGESFVTRKITRGIARIHLGRQESLKLGNLKARRDWMHARDAARGMRLMLQHHQPDDFVLATGRSETVQTFAALAAKQIGRGVEFIGPNGQVRIESDPIQLRPQDVDHLQGDARKAKVQLHWQPEHSLEEIVEEMVGADLYAERQIG